MFFDAKICPGNKYFRVIQRVSRLKHSYAKRRRRDERRRKAGPSAPEDASNMATVIVFTRNLTVNYIEANRHRSNSPKVIPQQRCTLHR